MTAARLQLRRRLLMVSAPVALLLILAAVKMISVVVAGDSAASHFARGDASALRGDVSTLNVANVIEPAKARFAAGAAAVLDGRLGDADTEFSRALAGTDPGQSCPVRINLELVREAQGDVAAAEARAADAAQRYRSALAIAGDAPPDCFAGNTDPQPDRRQIRQNTVARLTAKLAGVQTDPAPPPPAEVVAPPPPPPPPPAGVRAAGPDTPPPALGPTSDGLSDVAPDRLPSPGAPPPGPHRLDPGSANPMDRLRQLLTDAASSGSDSQ
ncbi:hypothetical protein B1R94_16335 [Mycolicibacterium litorale]|nr:hypothetical protein B1R94_16335 [Mycolicibacterium litorale]